MFAFTMNIFAYLTLFTYNDLKGDHNIYCVMLWFMINKISKTEEDSRTDSISLVSCNVINLTITMLQLFNKRHILFSHALAWHARTISIWSATNNDANTSENDSMFSFISFWQSSNLNTNKQTRRIHEDKKRRQAARRFPSRIVRTNTIMQKYAFRASAVYMGIKTFHHDIFVTPSSRRTSNMLNTIRPIRWSQISNTESPSHRTTSSRVRNMFGCKNTVALLSH